MAGPGKKANHGQRGVRINTMQSAYIALGSNQNRPQWQVRQGCAALMQLENTSIQECSSLYRTAPVGLADQPDFINAVCGIKTTLPAGALMRALLDIESHCGRVRRAGQVGGPRTLDLDLLLYGDDVRNEPGLVLPHPRMHERAFVLAPLAEIAKDIIVPGKGSVTRLLAACNGQKIERLGKTCSASEIPMPLQLKTTLKKYQTHPEFFGLALVEG